MRNISSTDLQKQVEAMLTAGSVTIAYNEFALSVQLDSAKFRRDVSTYAFMQKVMALTGYTDCNLVYYYMTKWRNSMSVTTTCLEFIFSGMKSEEGIDCEALAAREWEEWQREMQDE